MLTSLGLDSSVGNHDDGPFELVFEVLNHLGSNLFEVGEGPVWNSNQDVLGGLLVGLLEFNFLGRVEVDELQVLLKVLAAGLEGLERLCDLFLEFSGSGLKLEVKGQH